MIPLVVGNRPRSVIAEAYRTLRTNLQFATKDENIKRILITSPVPGEGKSITASNLAFSMSQTGKRVILIDCDLRKPSIHKCFAMKNTVGLGNMILEGTSYEKVLQKHSENLYIITAGKVVFNPAEILNTEYFSNALDLIEKDYDYIFLDSPPVTVVTDDQIMAAVCQGVILVVSSGESKKDECKRAIELLNNVNANILGVVLNKVRNDYKEYYESYHKEDMKKRK